MHDVLLALLVFIAGVAASVALVERQRRLQAQKIIQMYSAEVDLGLAHGRNMAKIASRNIGLATALIQITEPEDWPDEFMEDQARAEVFASAVELLEIREGRHLQRIRIARARGEL